MILLTCRIGTLPAPLYAQSASDAEATKRTVLIPDAGAVVTFPLGWRIWPPDVEALSRVATRLIAGDAAAGQRCFIAVRDGSTAEAVAPYGDGDEVPEYIVILDRTTVSVSAGDAFYVAWRFDISADEPRKVRHDYYVPAPGGIVEIRCSGLSPPADRWLDIVETIVPLPATMPMAPPFDPRVAVPDHRISIEFASEWWVERYDGPARHLSGAVEVLDVMMPEPGSRCWLEVGGDPLVLEAILGFGADWPSAWATTLEEAFDLGQAQYQGEVPAFSVSEVELPSGRAVRAGYDLASEPSSTWWTVSDRERLASLFCESVEPPDDRWRSIAETIELLPTRD
jgi:hypothetical protein